MTKTRPHLVASGVESPSATSETKIAVVVYTSRGILYNIPRLW